MSVFEKSRMEIWNQLQHPYKHTLGDFAYANEAAPWVTSLEGAMNALFAANYPNTQASVNTPADLPLVGNDPLDYRVVIDDGDGKGAGYRWEKREGEADYTWHKIYDMDWGEETILSNFLTKTNDTYLSKFGQEEIDENGDIIVGDLAGQYVYGGSEANSNLTLYANSGDGTGPNTGFVQFGDQIRPIDTGTYSIGTAAKTFKDLFLSGIVNLSNITITDDLLVSSTGQFNFDNDNILTTGELGATTAKLEGSLTLKGVDDHTAPDAGYYTLYLKTDGTLYKKDSADVESVVGVNLDISNDERLLRSDGTTGIQDSGITISDTDAITGVVSLGVGAATLTESGIVRSSVDADFGITANGTGSVAVNRLKITGSTEDRVLTPNASGVLTETAVEIDTAGNISGANTLDVGNMTMDNITLSSTSNLVLKPTSALFVDSHILPLVTEVYSLGNAAQMFNSITLSGGLTNATEFVDIDTLISLRDINEGVVEGHSLFYSGGKWTSSAPDTEITHGNLSGLGADDHTQYVAGIGRAGGQSVRGGIVASENLTLDSTSHATKGKIIVASDLEPDADNTISIGTGSKRLKDLYMGGEAKGLRAENTTTATLPASSAANIGRVAYNTDTKQLIVDTGLGWSVEGVNKYITDLAFDGIVLFKDVTVSSTIADVRNCQVQLLNNNDDFDRIYCKIKATDAATIRIETNTPLPVGSYRLVVIE